MKATPHEIREAEVELEVDGERHTLPNDYVLVCVGGESKIGLSHIGGSVGLSFQGRDLYARIL